MRRHQLIFSKSFKFNQIWDQALLAKQIVQRVLEILKEHFRHTLKQYKLMRDVVSRVQLRGNYDQAILDFNKLLEQNDKNARAHFYKGKILKNKGQENEAVLHFEQVIKNSQQNNNQNHQQSVYNGGDDQLLSGNSLFEIAKIRIKQKDFYEAFHNLQRAVHYDFKSLKFMQYKMFVEGVLFIMKRKVKKGIKMLTSLVEGQITYDAKEALNSSSPITINNIHNKVNLNDSMLSIKEEIKQGANNALKQHLVYLIYTYRSYGYIVTQQLDKALNDLNKAQKLRKLEQSCVYNRFITQALVKMEKKDLNGVKSILSQAELKFPNNKDPYKFQAICTVQGCISEIVDVDNQKKRDQIYLAKSILDRAIDKNPKDANLLYLRGLILYYLHSFYEALIDLDAAIDIDEEPSAKLYLARGRCHACLSMFQEAITDLTKAIDMDEELSDAYFNRGKCAYLLGDTALAFLDFQKLILLEPKNPMVHIYAGNLLMTTGSYDDATKAFTNADSVQKSALAFYQRSRCYIALANLDQALKDLNLVVERSPSDKIAYVDKECLQTLKNAILASQVSQPPSQQVMSPTSKNGGYDVSVFAKGVITFNKLLNTHYEIESNTTNTTSASRMHQQIIPNVKRIKIEKMRALRRKRAKDAQTHGGLKKTKKIRVRFFLEDSTDDQLKSSAIKIEPYSYYKENIFGQEDFYLYRGIMNFYSGEYDKAIQDYELSIKSKQDQKDLEGNNNGGDDNQSNSSNQTDLSNVGLCSLNIHESHFNILLCLILKKDYKQCMEKINKLIQEVPKKYVKSFYLIRGIIQAALGNNSKNKSDFEIYQKTDPQTFMEFTQNKQSVSLNPFPLGNRVCAQFPEIKFSVPSQLQQTIHSFYSRPSFSFPFVKPPNMIPNVDESVLQSEFDLKNVTPPKPEAPWIKRCDYGIKFTDEIQVVDESTALFTETEESMIIRFLQTLIFILMQVNNGGDNQQNQNHEDGNSSDDSSSPFRNKNNPQDYNAYQNPYQNLQDPNQQQNLNERYYLRNYVKEQRAVMLKAISEQVMRNEFNFFREEMEEENMNRELMEQEMIMNDTDDTIAKISINFFQTNVNLIRKYIQSIATKKTMLWGMKTMKTNRITKTFKISQDTICMGRMTSSVMVLRIQQQTMKLKLMKISTYEILIQQFAILKYINKNYVIYKQHIHILHLFTGIQLQILSYCKFQIKSYKFYNSQVLTSTSCQFYLPIYFFSTNYFILKQRSKQNFYLSYNQEETI